MEALGAATQDVEWIPVEESSAPGRVRRAAVALAERLGFSAHRAGELAIGATELATNLARHAVEGAVLLRARRTEHAAAVELILIDSGPGFTDWNASARDGTSTSGTLGIGIGAAMRLASSFDVHSVVGRGTVMIATFWRDAVPATRPAIGALTRTIHGETACGDASAYRLDADATSVLLVDGLGHGDLAASAARQAVRAFLDADDDLSPARALQRINAAVRGSRGAAAAIVRLDAASATLTFAGVGNVAVWIDHGERRQSLVSTPGIIGSYTRTIREVALPLVPGSLVLLHSDGLTSKWDLNAYPGLRMRDPHLVAATLMRDAGVHRDDASVTVARAS